MFGWLEGGDHPPALFGHACHCGCFLFVVLFSDLLGHTLNYCCLQCGDDDDDDDDQDAVLEIPLTFSFTVAGMVEPVTVKRTLRARIRKFNLFKKVRLFGGGCGGDSAASPRLASPRLVCTIHFLTLAMNQSTFI